MKIGIDARFFRPSTGGLSRYTRNLLKYLFHLAPEIEWVVFLTTEDKKEFDLKGDNIEKVIVDIPHYSLKEQYLLPRILNSYHLDLVHFTNFNHPIFYKGPFVVTIHDLTMFAYPAPRQRVFFRRLPFIWTLKKALQRSQKIFVPSQATANDLDIYFAAQREKIVVTPEGVEPVFRPLVPQQKKENQLILQQKLGIQTPYILFVSQWRPHKGILELLDAYEVLKYRWKIPINLVLVGSPHPAFPEIASCVEKVQRKATGIFTPGFVQEEELVLLYQMAKVFVLPSFYEGFGLPVLEAMASGVPVVCSQSSALPEVGGQAVFYCDPYRYHTIAKGLKKVLTDRNLQSKLRAEGLKRAHLFNWKKMAKMVLKNYKAIISSQEGAK